MHLDNSTITRFWRNVNVIDDENSCWEWQASRTEWGYGRIYVGPEGRAVRSHRLAYELEYGPIPDNMIVLHTCDNPPCCRPSHLVVGTFADNTHDMIRKGRQPKGENHKNAVLTAGDVQEIKRRILAKENQRRLANEFGVSPATITLIKQSKTWRE